MKTVLKRWCMGLCLALLCLGAKAQAPISGQVINQYGQPLPNATIRVCSVNSTGNPCTPVASLYYDYALSMPAPNPAPADQYGNYLYYVGATSAPDLYMIQVTPASGITWNYVVNGPFCPLSGCSFSGSVTATFFNATTFPYYEINGVQVSCETLLSDCSNIARLNVANVFTASPQTAPIFNATTQFNVAGVQIASANLSDGANLAKLNASNTFTGSLNTFADITGTTINATTGFEVSSGAGTSGFALCSNGTVFNTPCEVYSPSNPPPAGSSFYQTMESNGTSETQRAALNFSTNFVLSDSASPSRTGVDLITVGTPGTYAYPTSVTTDGFGRVTAISAGSAVSRVCSAPGLTWSCYRVESDGTIEEWGVAGPIPSGADSGTVAITFPFNFTTTNFLEINTNPNGCAGNLACGGDWVLETHPIGPTITTTGFTAYAGAGVTPGGGGSNITATNLYIHWHATGN